MKPLKVAIPKALLSPQKERRIRVALAAGLGQRPDVDVALDLGISSLTVGRYRRLLGLAQTAQAIQDALRHGVVFRKTDEEVARGIRRFAGRGFSRFAIALRLHATVERVDRAAAAYGIALPRSSRRRRAGSRRPPARRRPPRGAPSLPPAAEQRWRTYLEATYGPRAKAVDWALRDDAIAKRAGVGVRTVREWRRRLRLRGLPIPRQPRHPWIRRPGWREVDWRQPNHVIARTYRVGVHSVTYWRYLFRSKGHPVPPAPNPQEEAWLRKAKTLAPRIRGLARRGLHLEAIARELRVERHAVRRIAETAGVRIVPARTPVDWRAVDWSLSNTRIAGMVGVTPSRVCDMRGRLRRGGLAIPENPDDPCRLWRGRGREMVEAIQAMARQGLHLMRIARELQIAPNTVHRAAARAGIRIPSGRRWVEWRQVDWSRSDAEIAAALRISEDHVRRVRLRRRKAGPRDSPRRADGQT